MTTPPEIYVLEEVESTQDVARERADEAETVIVIAHRQTRGRGRSGSLWDTAPRSVAVSVAWSSDWEPSHRTLIPLLAGVSARRVLGDEVSLKWPNDVLLGDKKTGGILVEIRDERVVAGLGLNLHWPRPREGAAGLYPADPGPEEGPRVGTRWAEQLLSLVEEGPDRWPKREYEAACVTLGMTVEWEPGGRGEAVGVGDDGSLEVVTAAGELRSLISSEVRHVRPR